MSTQRGSVKFRPKVERPSFHRYSETVPTGHSQLQNDLRKTNEIARNDTNRKKPAACTRGTCPVTRKYFNCISPSMGSQPSTPAGRETSIARPPLSAQRTHR